MSTREVTAKTVPGDRIAEVVYSHVKSRITDGSIRPNEMLVEVEIAEQLGVSRSPVREALQRLVSNGLVDLVRRRWIVHEFTEEEIVQIYLVRAALESEAARLAASAITDVQREELVRFREKFKQNMKNDIELRVYRNSEFHDFVTGCSNNQRLIRFAEMNNTYHFNYNIATTYTDDDLRKSAMQHIALADAVLAGDGGAAHDIVQEHVWGALAMLRSRIFRHLG